MYLIYVILLEILFKLTVYYKMKWVNFLKILFNYNVGEYTFLCDFIKKMKSIKATAGKNLVFRYLKNIRDTELFMT